MITFEEARQIVSEKRGARMGGDPTFAVMDQGWETQERWIVVCTTEACDSGPWTSVDKVTGEYFEDPSVDGDRFPDKTPVG